MWICTFKEGKQLKFFMLFFLLAGKINAYSSSYEIQDIDQSTSSGGFFSYFTLNSIKKGINATYQKVKPITKIPGKVYRAAKTVTYDGITFQDVLNIVPFINEDLSNKIYKKINKTINKLTDANDINDVIYALDCDILNDIFNEISNILSSPENIMEVLEKIFYTTKTFSPSIGNAIDFVTDIDNRVFSNINSIEDIQKLRDIVKDYNLCDIFAYINEHRDIFYIQEIQDFVEITNSRDIFYGLMDIISYLSDKNNCDQFIDVLFDFFQDGLIEGVRFMLMPNDPSSELIVRRITLALDIIQNPKLFREMVEYVYYRLKMPIEVGLANVTKFITTKSKPIRKFVSGNSISVLSIGNLLVSELYDRFFNDGFDTLKKNFLSAFDSFDDAYDDYDNSQGTMMLAIRRIGNSIDEVEIPERTIDLPFEVAFLDDELPTVDSVTAFEMIKAAIVEILENKDKYIENFPVQSIFDFFSMKRSEGFDVKEFITRAFTHSQNKTEELLQTCITLLNDSIPLLDVVVKDNQTRMQMRNYSDKIEVAHANIMKENITSETTVCETFAKIIKLLSGKEINSKVITVLNYIYDYRNVFRIIRLQPRINSVFSLSLLDQLDNINDLMSQRGELIESFDILCRYGVSFANLPLVNIIEKELQADIKPYAKGMQTIIYNIKEGHNVIPYDYVQLIADPESIEIIQKEPEPEPEPEPICNVTESVGIIRFFSYYDPLFNIRYILLINILFAISTFFYSKIEKKKKH